MQQRGNIRVVVLNNGTHKDHEFIDKTYGHRITLLDYGYNSGFAQGNNYCVDYALSFPDTSFIVLLNNDAEFQGETIDAMIQVYMTTHAECIVPCIYTPSGALESMGLTRNAFYHPYNRTSPKKPIFGPTGACMMLTGSAVERLTPLFRIDYFAYAEDYELGYRMRTLGIRTECGYMTKVVHKGQGSTSYLSYFSLYHTYRNLLFTYRIHLLFFQRIYAIIGVIPYFIIHGIHYPKWMIPAFITGVFKKINNTHLPSNRLNKYEP